MRVSVGVSVLLPVRDAEATLPAALASIARQSLSDWECVIVDDGSRDASASIARSFADRDARFRVVSRPASGLVAALEAGRALCQSPLIARMDADDLMHRDRLAAQVAALDDDSLTAVGSHVRLFPRSAPTRSDRAGGASRGRDRSGLREYETWLNSLSMPDDIARDAFIECPIAHPTLMIRHEALSYRDHGWPEDYDLLLRLLADGKRIGMVPRRLLQWRDGPARLSRTSTSYSLERFAACKAEFLARGFLANGDEYDLCGFGSTGKLLRAALLAHAKRPARIFEISPRRLGNVIDGAPIVPLDQLTRERPMIVCISGLGPRTVARSELAQRGLVEQRDFLCAS